MDTSYEAAAGPSRRYDQHMPLSPSTSSDLPAIPSGFTPTGENGRSPWGHGHSDNVERSDVGDRSAEATKRNPLVDLIDTERLYVEQLGLVIRRVAAAWSRKDFPPPQLDSLFRSVEAVYRANRGFGQKLKDIGPNPSSPKALGDLLMRWIDDLEPAYHKYSTTFMTGFDSYAPVNRNTLLPGILTDISGLSPPPPPLTAWSLDALFILPYTRLRYYRKLYARLLRSTKEGRSDHKLLVVANQRLDALVSLAESRLEVDVSEEDSESPTDQRSSAGDRSRETSWPINERISRASSAADSSADSHSNLSPFSSRVDDPRTSAGSTATSMTQSPQRRPTVVVPKMTSVTPTKSTPTSATGAVPLSDLELRIDPERTIDLFTMQPKKCKLHMNPPQLSFTRFLRSSHDVTLYFTPNSTGQQVVHSRAHVFILADLFLVAEWMEASEKAAKAQEVAREQPERVGQGGPMPEMWLSYPPLAGKHLAVAEGAQANVLTVTIMRKETMVIHAESELARDHIMKDLLECIEFASSSTKAPPVPAVNLQNQMRSPSALSDSLSVETFPPLRYPSPFSPESSPSASPRPGDAPQMPPPPMAGNALASQMQNFSLEPGDTIAWNQGPSPVPPPQPQPQYASAGPSAPAVGVLPPRGASLRTRVTSNPTDMSMTAPQVPQMPYNSSDPALASHQYGAPRGAAIPRSASGRSVQSAPRPFDAQAPPMPNIRGPMSQQFDHPNAPSLNGHHPPFRSRSAEPLRIVPPDPPSARFSNFPALPGNAPLGQQDDSPPASPVEDEAATLTGPAVISAQMKCKVFLKQSHQQWKALGGGKLKLYAQAQGNVKQLVVEADNSSKTLMISTIVLTDGVERVAKTGVAVEISDRGKRTGIIYMIQLRNETSAAGLFESLLAGSDRAKGGR